jgi:hypothetical protein
MATLRSLYSTEVTADVPNDLLPPKPPVLTGQTQQVTQDGGVTHGRSLVTLNWLAPTENEDIGGEFLGVADGLAQQFETTYDPIVAGEEVYEMSNFGGPGRGDTSLTANANNLDKVISVGSVANFAIGDWVQIDGGGQTEYAEIANISGSDLELETRIFAPGGFTAGATVKEADATLKTGGGTDYTLTPATGIIDIVAGQFTSSNHIAIAYATTLGDLDGYTLLRNPVLFADTRYENVSLDGSTVVVSDAIPSGALSYQETLAADENGETWYYYLYAKDDEATPNRSEVASGGPLLAEMIPSIPQNLGKTVGDQAVILTWDVLGPGASDANTNGYNIYRNPGATLDPPNLEQLNAIVIPKAQLSFEDSDDGIGSGDRVTEGTVPLPTNGQFYTYVVEAEDTATSWTTGTQNQSSGQGAQTIASKTA